MLFSGGRREVLGGVVIICAMRFGGKLWVPLPLTIQETVPRNELVKPPIPFTLTVVQSGYCNNEHTQRKKKV